MRTSFCLTGFSGVAPKKHWHHRSLAMDWAVFLVRMVVVVVVVVLSHSDVFVWRAEATQWQITLQSGQWT